MSIHLTSCFSKFPQFWHRTLVCFRGLVAQVSVRFFSSTLVQDEHEGGCQGQCPKDASRKPTCLESFFPVTATALGFIMLERAWLVASQGNFTRLEVWVPTVGSPRTKLSKLCCQVPFSVFFNLFHSFRPNLAENSRAFPSQRSPGPWRSSPSRMPKSVARILMATRNGMATLRRSPASSTVDTVDGDSRYIELYKLC